WRWCGESSTERSRSTIWFSAATNWRAFRDASHSSRAAPSKQPMASLSRVPVRAHAVLKSPHSPAVDAFGGSFSPSDILHSTVAGRIKLELSSVYSSPVVGAREDKEELAGWR